jgi:hypothetical protein
MKQTLTVALDPLDEGLIPHCTAGAQRACAPTWLGVKESGGERCCVCLASRWLITVDVKSARCGDLSIARCPV